MTKEREKAIAILQIMEYTLSNQVGSTYCQKKYDAIRFAIKVLKQKPCKDSVNRADLLKQFEDRFIELQKLKHIKENKSLENEQLGVNWCINTLKDMPPATPIRKVGEWIKKNNDYFDWYECSECGYGSEGEMKYNRLCDVRTKFCPDCGSQNLKGEDE